MTDDTKPGASLSGTGEPTRDPVFAAASRSASSGPAQLEKAASALDEAGFPGLANFTRGNLPPSTGAPTQASLEEIAKLVRAYGNAEWRSGAGDYIEGGTSALCSALLERIRAALDGTRAAGWQYLPATGCSHAQATIEETMAVDAGHLQNAYWCPSCNARWKGEPFAVESRPRATGETK